jgi:hypothetical protein
MAMPVPGFVREADRDIPKLLRLPAHVRFLSMEPLLGAVQLLEAALAGLDWVIVGGESGPLARPMHPAWPRSLRDQCQAAGVAFFFKQHGEWVETQAKSDGGLVEDMQRDRVRIVKPDGQPDDHFEPGDVFMLRIGKKLAGGLLDGNLYRGFPNPLHRKTAKLEHVPN